MTNQTATARAQQINIDREARDGQFVMHLVEDASHWAACDIHTGAELDHYLSMCSHFEGYKDIHGIKPRWIDYKSMTAEDIDTLTASMYADYEAEELAKARRIDLEDARIDSALAATKAAGSPLTHNPFAALLG